MKIKYILPLAMVASLAAGQISPSQADNLTAQERKEVKAVAPNDTGRNVRDRDFETVQPQDQSNNSELLQRTANIRREIVARKDFSMDAQNIKIITLDNGTVVLRGPVRTSNEKVAIETIAGRISGDAPVKSYLEIINKG